MPPNAPTNHHRRAVDTPGHARDPEDGQRVRPDPVGGHTPHRGGEGGGGGGQGGGAAGGSALEGTEHQQDGERREDRRCRAALPERERRRSEQPVGRDPCCHDPGGPRDGEMAVGRLPDELLPEGVVGQSRHGGAVDGRAPRRGEVPCAEVRAPDVDADPVVRESQEVDNQDADEQAGGKGPLRARSLGGQGPSHRDSHLECRVLRPSGLSACVKSKDSGERRVAFSRDRKSSTAGAACAALAVELRRGCRAGCGASLSGSVGLDVIDELVWSKAFFRLPPRTKTMPTITAAMPATSRP